MWSKISWTYQPAIHVFSFFFPPQYVYSGLLNTFYELSLLEFRSFLYMPSDISVMNVFFQSVACLQFSCLSKNRKFIILTKSNLPIFFPLDFVLFCILFCILSNPRSQTSVLSQNFYIFSFNIQVCDLFQVNFSYGMKQGSRYIFFL